MHIWKQDFVAQVYKKKRKKKEILFVGWWIPSTVMWPSTRAIKAVASLLSLLSGEEKKAKWEKCPQSNMQLYRNAGAQVCLKF